MANFPIMKENQFSLFGRVSVYLMLGALCIIALMNIWHGKVLQPSGFFIVIAGFVLFLISKLRVIAKGRIVSFGTKYMGQCTANLYRMGYWLMSVGLLIVFLG